MATPKSMRSLLQPNKDSTYVTLITCPVPTPDSNSLDEHTIHVYAVAITNGELLWPKFFPVEQQSLPAWKLIPCYDFSGVVLTAPVDSPFKIGDEVYGRSDYRREGSGRDFTIVTTRELAHKPKNLSWAEAATVPMSAQTAWQALFVHAGLEAKAGKGAQGIRVFITGASGAVGIWLVQLLRWAGCEDVVGTCNADNIDRIKSLGASEVLDYRTTNPKSWASDESKKVDLVIDCIGSNSLADAWWVLKDSGTLISISGSPQIERPAELRSKTIKSLFFIMEPIGSQLGEVTRLIEQGGFSVALDSVFALERFEEAFSKLASGKTKGKIVLDMEVL